VVIFNAPSVGIINLSLVTVTYAMGGGSPVISASQVGTVKLGVPLQLEQSGNADGPRDTASRKIDNISLPTKYNYQATSVGR